MHPRAVPSWVTVYAVAKPSADGVLVLYGPPLFTARNLLAIGMAVGHEISHFAKLPASSASAGRGGRR
jgi:hypothetical protein